MTGEAIFKRAMALMVDDDSADYRPFALEHLNIMLAETFGTNNGLRVWAGKEPLDKPPIMANLADECPYEEQITGAAFPYGLASKLLFDDGDLNKVAILQNLYAGFVADCVRGGHGAREDVYADD